MASVHSLLSLISFATFGLGIAENIYDCKINGDPLTLYLATNTSKVRITDETALDTCKTMYFVLHGWSENSSSYLYPEIESDLYTVTGANVIMVDYGELGEKPYMSCAWTIMATVGNHLVQYILEQIYQQRMTHKNIHLIGHSLGGQISGYVGRQILQKTGKRIRRISAMDAAGPRFTHPFLVAVRDASLTSYDAEVVDALHTSLFIGGNTRMGSIDFFVSGLLGINILLPPCTNLFDVTCGHALSKALFRESITSCGIIGRYWFFGLYQVPYGFHMPEDQTGTYNIYINSKSPFGQEDPVCKKQID